MARKPPSGGKDGLTAPGNCLTLCALMKSVTLKTSARDQKITPKQLRTSGQVPCVVYGNVENTLLQCEQQPLKQAYMAAGESTLVNLEMDGKAVPVLFHAMDFHPISGLFTHVDFYAVNMNKEVEASVALHFEGESAAVKDGGILVTPVDHLTVRCLPKDLPHNLSVNLGTLSEMHAVITVKDIVLPAGVTVDDDPEMVVATVQEPRKEEEASAPSAAEAAPGAEGAAAAPAAPAAEKKEEKK